MPPPPLQRTPNASSWWERSIVKRSTHSIQSMCATMMEDSHFLQKQEQATNSNILALHRKNVQVGALLGKGSFSVVYEVKGLIEDREPEHDCTFGSSSLSLLDRQDLKSLEGRFAIKHLRPDLVQKPEMFQAAAADLLLEAKYLAALNHPGILKLRAVAFGGVSAYETTGGQYDGYFLITDRLDGTLRDKILEWQVLQQDESLLECLPVSEEEVKDDVASTTGTVSTQASLSERLLLEKLDIARQMASALQYMHDRRLVFRDLKPPNVGLTGDNRVRLFDFGFCRELPSWGGELAVPEGEEDDDDALYYMSGKGSLMYLAPEVLYNGRYNRKADCYSFAMVLFEILTLNKPFHSVAGLEVFRELLCRHKARPPLEYSEIPPQLQDLLRHSWEDTVRERWTMRKINQRLQEISQELDPSFESTSANNQGGANESNSQLFDTCGGGGLLLELIAGLAQDVQSGYRILSGNSNKVLELQRRDSDQPQTPQASTTAPNVVATAPQCVSSREGQLTAVLTAATEESSILTMDGAQQSLRINAMTATEEPLEFTLEQAMSMSGWITDAAVREYHNHHTRPSHPEEEEATPLAPPPPGQDGAKFVPAASPGREAEEQEEETLFQPLTPCATQIDEDAFRDHAPLTPQRDGVGGRGLEEERCPPSPLERMTSAPMEEGHHQHQQNVKTTTRSVELSPHYPPRRRQLSWDVKGFLPDPDSPHYPTAERGHASTGNFDFPESHFLPTAAEMRG